MAFTPEHDQWVKQGLIDATFTLHLLPMGKGFHQWGDVEDLPVDVYYCDFEQYDPPDGFPQWDVCCVRTKTAWWIVLTQPLFFHLALLSQDGELPQDFYHTITFLNERHIGAWLWVRDRGVSGELALAMMDDRMVKRYGENYQAVKAVLDQGMPHEGSNVSLMFGLEVFNKETLEPHGLEEAVLDFHRRLEPTQSVSGTAKCLQGLGRDDQKLSLSSGLKWSALLVLLVVVLVIEVPRSQQLYHQVYGPNQVDLKERFPAIEWVDHSGESLFENPLVSRALHQAIVWRNPYQALTPIQAISVAKLQQDSRGPIYRWTVVSDEIAQNHQVRIDMEQFSGRHMRALENAVSGYKNLRLILCSKLVLLWGGNGRFVVLFTASCLWILGRLVMRVVRRVKSIEADDAVRNCAAGPKILESVAQDKQAAENLMLFNQDRRLRMNDEGTTEDWEREAFDWIDHNIAPETGQTRRSQRDEAL